MEAGGAAAYLKVNRQTSSKGGHSTSQDRILRHWIGVENCYVFKSRLQEYAQKAGLPTPEYQTLKEGPSHEPIFKSTVLVNGVTYESLPGFFSRKAAEQSAAEIALMEVGKSGPLPTNKSIPAVQETGLCKNLLQEYAQKMNYAIPSYICTKLPSGIAPFLCTVEIGGIQYIGAAARTKKEAEIKAARTALLAIQGQSQDCANSATKYIVVPGKRQGKEVEKKPIETPKPLKVKKGGSKNKWNKRKLARHWKGQPVDAGKDEARVAGGVNDSDVPMQPTMTTQEPSSDAAMLQLDEEARRVEQEPPSCTPLLLPHEEARRVEHESFSDTTMAQHSEDNVKQEPHPVLPPDEEVTRVQQNEEARNVNHEPLSDTPMPQPNESHPALPPDNVKQEPHPVLPPDEEVTRLQQNEEARNVKHEPLSDTSTPRPNESLGDSATVQPIVEATNIMEEALSNAAVTPH